MKFPSFLLLSAAIFALYSVFDLPPLLTSDTGLEASSSISHSSLRMVDKKQEGGGGVHDPKAMDHLRDQSSSDVHRLLERAMSPVNRLLQGTTNADISSSGGWKQLGKDIIGEESNDGFGTSLATNKDGSFIIAGSPKHGSASTTLSPGHARVFKYDSSNKSWVQVGGDIDGGNYDLAGTSVDMNDDGDIVIVGSPGYGMLSYYSGRARVYQNVNDTWIQLGQDLNGEGSDDDFGWDVAISHDGKRVIVGGPKNDGNVGHAKVYEFNNKNQRWDLVGDEIEEGVRNENAGRLVDINGDGDVIAVGYNEYHPLDNGRIRIYRNIDGQWVQQGQEVLGGIEVAISRDGGRIVIGRPYERYSGGYARIYEYNKDALDWRQVGNKIAGGEGTNELGYTVDISGDGDVVVIGARFDNANADKPELDHVRIYRDIDGQWVRQGQELDGDKKKENFGMSVAISRDGKRVVAGGPGRNLIGEIGSVRVFEFDEKYSSSTHTPIIITALLITIIIILCLLVLRKKHPNICGETGAAGVATNGLEGTTSVDQVPVAQVVENTDPESAGLPFAQVTGHRQPNSSRTS